MANDAPHTTITIPEIADRLDVCEETVYDLCKRHVIPSIRPGRRFIISRAAYEKWEATIGEKPPLDMHRDMFPGRCRVGREKWDEREEQLFTYDEMVARAFKSKKPEST